MTDRTSPADLDTLRKLLDAATPGPWKYPYGGDIVTVSGGLYDKVRVVSGEMQEEDAAYIAAANPATVLRLLSDLEALRARVRDFAATWHTASGHDGHIDNCGWSTCAGLLTGEITRGDQLVAGVPSPGVPSPRDSAPDVPPA